MRPTDEQLTAYVDGALPPAEAQEIEVVLQTDAEARAYVETLRKVNALVREAMDQLVPPPPAALVEKISAMEVSPQRTTNVVPLSRVRRTAPTSVRRYAMAASVAAVVGLTAAILYGTRDAGTALLTTGPVDAASKLAAMLEHERTGASIEARDANETVNASVVATYQDKQGRYCREIELSNPATLQPKAAAIACRSDAGTWTVEGAVEIAAAQNEGAGTGYQPSGADEHEPLSQLLKSLGTGKSLSPSDEDAARARNWK
jgi:hypothetical protein